MAVTLEEQARRDLLAGRAWRECLEAGCTGDTLLLALAVRLDFRLPKHERTGTWDGVAARVLAQDGRRPRNADWWARHVIDLDRPRYRPPDEQDPEWGKRLCDYPMVRRPRCGRVIGWQGGAFPEVVDELVTWRAVCHEHARVWGWRQVRREGRLVGSTPTDEYRDARAAAARLPWNSGGHLARALPGLDVPYRNVEPNPQPAVERPPLRLVWDADRLPST